MTRTLGEQDRTEYVLDPAEAWRRGRALDRMLATAAPPHPRGVFRGTHRELSRLDAQRAVQVARQLNRRG